MQFVRVPDGLANIRRAWDELEAVVAAPRASLLRRVRPHRERLPRVRRGARRRRARTRSRNGTLPRSRCLRARLRGEPPGVYEQIGPTFDELARQAKPDETRPGLEHYRRHDEIDLLLPI